MVGHSYGGAPITRATPGAADVCHIVWRPLRKRPQPPPSHQEPFVERTGAAYRLPSTHTPLLSMRGKSADLLEQIAHGVPA
jgi:hypothetical protein